MKKYGAILLLLISLSSYCFSQSKIVALKKVVAKEYPNGSPSIVFFFNDQDKKVKEISYHPNGRKDYEGNFKDGVEHGKWIYWHPNGNKMFKEFYKNGLEEGKHSEYSANGQLVKIEFFKQGKLLREVKY